MKKVIRLTEADIERIVRQVIQEQKDRDKTDVKRNKGRRTNVDYSAPNWNGKNKGGIDLDAVNNNVNDTGVVAFNVGKQGYNMRFHTYATKSVLKGTPNQPGGPNKTLETFEIPGSSLPYADNMVKPYFDKYPEAKTVFDKIVQKFSDYINAGGGDKLTDVTIKGSADSARPTTKVPRGYSSLDHPGGTPYGGKTDPKEMNQYLADTRASEYANALKTAIKTLTEFDLNIKVLPGDNYYGQGNSKRGEEFRKIILTPNAPPLDSPTEIPAPGVDNTTTELKFKSVPATLEYWSNGVLSNVNGYDVKENPSGNSFVGISNGTLETLSTPDIREITNGKLIDNNLYVNNLLVGPLKDMREAPVTLVTHGNPPLKFAGPITYKFSERYAEIEGEGKVLVNYVTKCFFLFY